VRENMKILRISISYFCISLLLSAQTTVAADRDAASECLQISAANERLACFDAAYAAQAVAPPSAPDAAVSAAVPAAAAVVSAPPLAVKTTPEEEFGLPQAAGKAATEEEFGLPQSQVQTLTSPITSVDQDPVGRLTFHLENGQAWKQTETKRFRIREDDPPVAVIRHGALGSFKLSVEGGSVSTRVKRIK
jgi:hypothetical protein